ncbi:UNKNOWN [Stylonychia lemnae]|uniref:Uncharacterized protein n=1 Tax=Stylonychia lemnae TaxID=5949 RepID=A0A078AL20_STYLE|nr:UNKNOWN [Stylonychia lemnae]|eukprot:CDW82132.1 UNKNOWN [Stylonychia lemnae]
MHVPITQIWGNFLNCQYEIICVQIPVILPLGYNPCLLKVINTKRIVCKNIFFQKWDCPPCYQVLESFVNIMLAPWDSISLFLFQHSEVYLIKPLRHHVQHELALWLHILPAQSNQMQKKHLFIASRRHKEIITRKIKDLINLFFQKYLHKE